ncbi:hypothetical protein [Cellvibrio polysaccharolyticus]|nr:hypothetical protein [Cellvibrio polysaccharolyticus]
MNISHPGSPHSSTDRTRRAAKRRLFLAKVVTSLSDKLACFCTTCARLGSQLSTKRWWGKAMVYVERDQQQRLLRVSYEPFEGMNEVLAIESPELHDWLKTKEEVKARLDSLNSSDLELVRVLEDVVIVLVDRGVIQYTDLPEAARTKLDQRAIARADLEGLTHEVDVKP